MSSVLVGLCVGGSEISSITASTSVVSQWEIMGEGGHSLDSPLVELFH